MPQAEIDRWVTDGLIEHHGWVADMPALLGRTHLVCLPSYYGEGIPKSLIDAAAAGLPIVTTDMPGCREIVNDEDNGLLVPPRNTESLAAALRRLIENPSLRRQMGLRGRIRAEQEFGQEKIIQLTMSVYESIVP